MGLQRWWPSIGGTFLGLGVILLSSCAHPGMQSMPGMAEEWEAPAGAAEVGNPVVADPTSVEAGRATYRRECQVCHGKAGTGNGPGAIALERRPGDLSAPMMRHHSDGALYWKVTEGRPPMPSFQNLLTDRERWQVVNYIRTFATAGTPGGEPPMHMGHEEHAPTGEGN